MWSETGSSGKDSWFDANVVSYKSHRRTIQSIHSDAIDPEMYNEYAFYDSLDFLVLFQFCPLSEKLQFAARVDDACEISELQWTRYLVAKMNFVYT